MFQRVGFKHGHQSIASELEKAEELDRWKVKKEWEATMVVERAI